VQTHLLMEGSGAREAAEALGELPGLTVDITERHADESRKDLVVLSVVATVVTIVGSVFTVADQIIRWRREQKEKRPVTIERVIIVRGDQRFLLDGLDTAELTDLLAPDAEQPDAAKPDPDQDSECPADGFRD